MARNNDLVVTAGLNIEASVTQIEKDLKQVNDRLSADHALKIIANVDLSKTTQRINSQLATISKNLNLNIPKIELGMADGGGTALINNVDHIVDDVENKILELKQNLAKEFGVNIEKIITNTVKNARGQISSFSFDLTKLSGDVEKFNYTVNRQKDKDNGSVVTTVKQTSSRDSDRGAIKLLERQEVQVDKLTQKLIKLKADFDNVNAPRPILNQDNIDRLNDEYSKTDEIIKNIGNSTSETFDKMVSDANKAILVYENFGKTMRDAENTATELSSKDIGSAKSLLGGNIDKFIGRVSKSSIADSNAIIGKAEEIKKSLNDIGDAHGLKIARDNLNKLRGEFDSLDAQAKSASFAETLKNRVEKLSATMSAFAEKNERAVRSVQTMSSGKTFAQEWQELSNTLSKGGLNPDDLRHLQERFTIFGKEAEAAGLKGKTAWEKFLGTFKTFSSYITANMVFNVFKRQISSMVQEVISLDSAMTELRKVTEATEPEFNKFLETAKRSAQYLGSSVTDLVDATSTFSRLGYTLSEAQNLGEVATLYKNVGDGIDISTASESIVSTLKAFKIEAEDAIGIVDKLNEVGNNFAISSGGIGEALLRSASAMAAANNDLSQSIALITTANTIAQNPEFVGTGLKTMALRLRSTKTEIEEMGEDAEGAAENVSKLREQVLALTKNKVDIQLDENTYKSSYDILLEISKVWNELNDMSRASLLEQLFGKRQANVGAAILENGELLQQVYETAESSIGSATKEQEKFAKSIQYSMNSFKATYQTLVSDIVDSEFVKSLVDLGSTVVKGLDFIITKTGILQGILVGFGSLAIFKTVPALITKIKTLGTSIASFSAIMNTLDGSGKGGQILTTNQLAMASKNLTDRQFELVLSTKQLTEAQLTEMMTARGFTKEQIQAQIAIRNQTLASAGLATAEQGATAATFSLSGAVKGLTAAIAANPIGAIVTAVTLLVTVFTSLKRKQEEAIVEAKRLEEERQRNLETTINELKAFENEQKSVGEITNRYVALYNTTANIADKKEELTKITDELNEKFGDEKSQIDLVNNSISENIELIRQQQSEMDKQWQRDNKSAIEEAQKFVDNNSGSMVASYEVSNELVGANGDKYDEALKEAEFYFNRMNHLIDENDKELWKYLDTFEETTTDKFGNVVKTYGYKLKEGIDRDVVPDVLKSFRDLYEQLDKYDYMNFNFFTGIDSSEALNQAISDWDKYLEVLQKNESINNELWDNTSITLDGTEQKFNELIDAASEASQKMNATDVLPADVYTYSRQIEEIRVELEELAKSSPELQKRMEIAFSTIGLQVEDVSESADLLKKNFFDTLDEMQKGVFTKVDKINDAITNMLSGEGLKSAEAWELLDMDTTRILNPVIDANGKWIMQSEELVALKERLVGLTKEQVAADLQAAQKQVTEIEKQLNEQYGIIKTQQEIISQQAHGNTKPNETNIRLLSAAKDKVNELLKAQQKYSDEVRRDNLLLQELNSRLQMTTEQLEKQLEQTQKQADALLKAQEYKIDQIIDGHQEELDALNDEKDALQEELDALNEQKDALDEIVKNYETVNSLVQNTIEKEIDSLNEQKKAIEDTYNKRIEALKAENEEREDALEYAQKLANLENAKNNKRRVYDEARGWRYEAVKEDVAKAQNDLAEFETSKAVKELEKERDKETAVIDDLIKNKEEYAKIWKEISDEIQTEEDERLAQEILGADWREKIAAGDIAIMEKFRAEYRNHNTALQNLTKTEIKLKEESIKAKEADIKAKKEQIDIWKKYKSEVEKTAEAIKAANEDYMDYLNSVSLSEQSTYADRQANLQNFASRYSSCISQIKSYQQELDNMNVGLYIDTNIGEVADEMANFIDTYRDAIEAMQKALDESETGYGVVNSAWDAMLAKAANEMRKRGYSQGGVVDYTGVAMLHGRKNAPETIFNAKDSAKLYEMVHNTPNLMASAMTEANKIAGFKLGNTNTNNSSVNISSINVYANNPSELARGLDKQLDQYFRSKLTQNYTSK